jgi:hypothetical protein
MNLTAQVAERYVRDAMALDPVSATLAGISGFDDQMADLTPDGFEARAEFDRRTIAAIREVAPASEPEQVARTAMLERLGLAVEQYDAGETTSEISVIASWMHSVRAVFDLMPVNGSAEDRDGAPSRSSALWSWVVVPDFPGGGAGQGQGDGQQDAGFLGLELPEPAGGLVADLAAQVLAGEPRGALRLGGVCAGRRERAVG